MPQSSTRLIAVILKSCAGTHGSTYERQYVAPGTRAAMVSVEKMELDGPCWGQIFAVLGEVRWF